MASYAALPANRPGRKTARMSDEFQAAATFPSLSPFLPVPSVANSIQSVKAAFLRVLLVETDLRDRQMGRRTKANDFESDEE